MRNRRYKPRAYVSPYGVTRPLLPCRLGDYLRRQPGGRGRYPTTWYRTRVFFRLFTDL
jgi:hypothetical protein